jgi:3-hydroxyisobutyrate dehydrogenase-like beta-hydroxyacid dehydrogenase
MIVANLGAKTVAVLGLGEAGSLIARDLVRGGATVRGWDPDLHGDLGEIPLAASLAEAVSGADIVISVNWSSVAAAVAREALPLLQPGALYADHNTSGPALKRELAAIVEPRAAFVDVAMMAPVPPLGIRVEMFLAGTGAAAFAAFLAPFGTPTTIVGTAPGEAAARKLTRSVFFKGMSAAVCEALEAARAAGVEDWLRSDIAKTFANADAALLDRLVVGTHRHAKRRAHEMHDAAAMLAELHVPAVIAAATAQTLDTLVERQRLGSPVLHSLPEVAPR